MQFDAIIFDFDGVLLESEFDGNCHLARLLTDLGYPTSVEDALTHFIGLSGGDFIAAIESRIEQKLPQQFYELRSIEAARALREGVAAVAGAVEFVQSLPAKLPKAVASSSSSEWVRTHLKHIGLADAFGTHLYSGREHVARAKPAPDLYLHASRRLGVNIGDCVIIEDSEVGAKGALASGAQVVGLVAGSHCLAGHDKRLERLGIRHIAHSFDELRRLLDLE